MWTSEDQHSINNSDHPQPACQPACQPALPATLCLPVSACPCLHSPAPGATLAVVVAYRQFYTACWFSRVIIHDHARRPTTAVSPSHWLPSCICWHHTACPGRPRAPFHLLICTAARQPAGSHSAFHLSVATRPTHSHISAFRVAIILPGQRGLVCGHDQHGVLSPGPHPID